MFFLYHDTPSGRVSSPHALPCFLEGWAGEAINIGFFLGDMCGAHTHPTVNYCVVFLAEDSWQALRALLLETQGAFAFWGNVTASCCPSRSRHFDDLDQLCVVDLYQV